MRYPNWKGKHYWFRVFSRRLVAAISTFGVDAFCPLVKSYWDDEVILHFHEAAQQALQKGVSLQDLENAQVLQKIARMKEQKSETIVERLQYLLEDIDTEISRISEKLERSNARG
jgi:V/A-type H+-transporting ATPase subunit A